MENDHEKNILDVTESKGADFILGGSLLPASPSEFVECAAPVGPQQGAPQGYWRILQLCGLAADRSQSKRHAAFPPLSINSQA